MTTKLTLINGTTAPDTLKERIRARLRKTRDPRILQCPSCGGRTYLVTQTATTKQKICAFCFINDKRMVTMA